MTRSEHVDLVVVGAGPCGLAAAIAAQRAGLTAVVFDRGPIVSGIAGYPTYMTFFSTAERIAIGGVPFIVATEKPTRRDALAYYRGVATHFGLDVRAFESVEQLTAIPDADDARGAPRWRVETRHRSGATRVTAARAVVVATGYFGRPNRLQVPGEALPHVRHGYVDGHDAWNETVVIVGGGNSAVDAALDMHRSGGRVTMVHFGDALDPNIKPWVRPEIEARIREGQIAAVFGARVTAIEPEAVVVRSASGEQRLPATQVYTMTGYLPETGLLAQVGVPIDATTGIPAHDPLTMATPLPGLYLAGVIASGLQANRIFIENGRDHGDLIVAHLRSS
ncbi:MAG: YpdA family putative bacillithiol disulfide reductase [Gemmatimonadaceae bacterium]|nr:YpdA family putative bacillithiol disulfide reductase [Gemmatimonadaceae bacterium]